MRLNWRRTSGWTKDIGEPLRQPFLSTHLLQQNADTARAALVSAHR
jgi:hypothetical protein